MAQAKLRGSWNQRLAAIAEVQQVHHRTSGGPENCTDRGGGGVLQSVVHIRVKGSPEGAELNVERAPRVWEPPAHLANVVPNVVCVNHRLPHCT